MWRLGCVLVTGCSSILGFEQVTPATPPQDDAPVGPDAAIVFPVAHLPPEAWAPGTADLGFDLDITIDTTALTIGGIPATPGAPFDTWPQVDGGELAVLHVRTFTVNAGRTMTVRGSRALVVIAAGDIVVRGTLDGAAVGRTPGPGGGESGANDVTGGGNGLRDSPFLDTGGGGGGNGTAGGAAGGSAWSGAGTCNGQTAGTSVLGGTAGPAITTDTLVGGGAGGFAGGNCATPRRGGGGGGALQLSTPTRISITGLVRAGGGGGEGGQTCGGDASAGGGGGAGGTIYLQAPTVEHAGVLVANGGGGGSGGSAPQNGAAGTNGRDDEQPALGGNASGQFGGVGGAGAAGMMTAQSSPDAPDCGNSGGGGGGLGRIVADGAALEDNGLASPTIVHVQR